MNFHYYLDKKENKKKEHQVRITVAMRGVRMVGTIGYNVPISMWDAKRKQFKKGAVNSDGVDSDIIIYGHDHDRNICRGDKFYINVGSLGCPSKEHDIARAGVLDIEGGKAVIGVIDVRYDVDEVIRQIDDLNYPEADVVKRIFYGL